MNQVSFGKSMENYDSGCVDSVPTAERELTAFFAAVKEIFGSEQARLSADDWMHELEDVPALPVSAGEWRRITINAARRLAARVKFADVGLDFFDLVALG